MVLLCAQITQMSFVVTHAHLRDSLGNTPKVSSWTMNNCFLTAKTMFFSSFSFWKFCEEDKTKCIPVFWLCDGKFDCPLGSDELGCPCEFFNMVEVWTVHNNSLCLFHQWACNFNFELKINTLCQGAMTTIGRGNIRLNECNQLGSVDLVSLHINASISCVFSLLILQICHRN